MQVQTQLWGSGGGRSKRVYRQGRAPRRYVGAGRRTRLPRYHPDSDRRLLNDTGSVLNSLAFSVARSVEESWALTTGWGLHPTPRGFADIAKLPRVDLRAILELRCFPVHRWREHSSSQPLPGRADKEPARRECRRASVWPTRHREPLENNEFGEAPPQADIDQLAHTGRPMRANNRDRVPSRLVIVSRRGDFERSDRTRGVGDRVSRPVGIDHPALAAEMPWGEQPLGDVPSPVHEHNFEDSVFPACSSDSGLSAISADVLDQCWSTNVQSILQLAQRFGAVHQPPAAHERSIGQVLNSEGGFNHFC
jgi:hypothetical protein